VISRDACRAAYAFSSKDEGRGELLGGPMPAMIAERAEVSRG
jgi:hypothetical protein